MKEYNPFVWRQIEYNTIKKKLNPDTFSSVYGRVGLTGQHQIQARRQMQEEIEKEREDMRRSVERVQAAGQRPESDYQEEQRT